jgi:hypothetical protein
MCVIFTGEKQFHPFCFFLSFYLIRQWVCVCDVACNKVQSLPFWVDVYSGSRQGGRLSSQITAVAGKKTIKEKSPFSLEINPSLNQQHIRRSSPVAPNSPPHSLESLGRGGDNQHNRRCYSARDNPDRGDHTLKNK